MSDTPPTETSGQLSVTDLSDRRDDGVEESAREFDETSWHQARRRKARLQIQAVAPWLPVLVVAPFFILFLVTALPRFLVPFELEWNEGQACEQAWRFAQGLPLYPVVDKDTPADQVWVPYMYSPLYHVTVGTLFKVSGVYTIAWGRLVSLLASLATAMAIQYIVWDRTRQLAPSVFAGLLYFAYYKATGYWYDIARVDALGYALGTIAMALCMKRKPRTWQGILGMALFVVAVFTKQTLGVPAVVATLVLLYNNPRAALWGGLGVAIFTANVVFVTSRSDNSAFFNYVVENPIKHASSDYLYYPGSNKNAFENMLQDPTSTSERFNVWVREIWRGNPAPIWDSAYRHVWLLGAMTVAWLLLAAIRRQWPRGWVYLLVTYSFIYIAIGGFAKYGGFLNNLLPIFLIACILAGFALNGLLRALGGNRALITNVVLALLVGAQLYQPWNMPAIDNGKANWEAWKLEHDTDLRQEIERYTWRLRDELIARRNGAEPPPVDPNAGPVSTRARMLYHLGRFCHGGLAWFPSHQQPHPESRSVYKDMMEWLRWKAEEGENVCVVHHQFYSITTGHPLSVNVDTVRCAIWAGDPMPQQLREVYSSGKYQWLVLNTPNPDHDWLAGDLNKVIRDRYDYVGTLPAYGENPSPRAMMPLTGAEIRPFALYRLKGFDGAVKMPGIVLTDD